MSMTREEAKDYIREWCPYGRQEEIIKALEQEPCEDAISRQAVLEIFGYVMDYWKEHAIDVEPHEIKDALIEQYEFTAKQLSELHPVSPQPKIGHWINDDGDNAICSCYNRLNKHCGAKMEVEENG